MFDQGVIDLDHLFKLQFAGPIGKVGQGGRFMPFSYAEQARIDARPIDYLQLAQDAMDGIRSQGREFDQTSGFQDQQRILDVLSAA